MKSYLALVEPGDEGHAYGIRFPDVPGVFSAADRKDDIVVKAVEALRLWAEDETLPEPSDPAIITQRADVKEDLRNGWYLVDVPLIESDPKVVRANVTFERGILEAIDSTAEKFGMSRSAYLTAVAKSNIERSSWPSRKALATTRELHPVAFANATAKAATRAAAKPAAKAAAKPGAKAASKPAAKAAAKPGANRGAKPAAKSAIKRKM